MAIPLPLRPPPLVRTLPPFKAKCKLVISSIRGTWVHHQPRCPPWSLAFCVSLVALMWFCYVSGSSRCAVPPTWDCEPPWPGIRLFPEPLQTLVEEVPEVVAQVFSEPMSQRARSVQPLAGKHDPMKFHRAEKQISADSSDIPSPQENC